MSDLSSIAYFTPQEWKRILKGRPFYPLVNEELETRAGNRAVSCMTCVYAAAADSMPWHGWCLTHRVAISDFPKLCPRWERRE